MLVVTLSLVRTTVLAKLIHLGVNHYHALIPWRLPDHKEPPLPLAEYDPLAIPTVEPLSAEELTEQAKIYKAKNEVLFLHVNSFHILLLTEALHRQYVTG